MKWRIYRADRERRSINLSAIYQGQAETLQAPLSAVLRVQPIDGGTPVDLAGTVTGGGTETLAVEVTIAPNALALGSHRAWLIVTWGDGPRTWPDPERDPAISIAVLDRP